MVLFVEQRLAANVNTAAAINEFKDMVPFNRQYHYRL